MAPRMPVLRVKTTFRISGFVFLLLATAGCLQSPRNHYVKSAKTNLASIPLVPAVLPSGKKDEVDLAFRVRQHMPTQTDFITRPVFETTPDPGSDGFRGNYAIRRRPFHIGVDMRQKTLEILDAYASADMSLGAGPRGAGLLGFGVTIPFPLLNVRLSPAFGIHGYTNSVVDSVITHHETSTIGITGSGESTSYSDTTIHVIDNRALRMGLIGSFSVSAWLPNPSGRSWTPYIQYQANWIGMGAKNPVVKVPSDIMILHARIAAVGMEYAPAKSFVWNTRLAAEYLWNRQDGAWGYRAETAIGLRLGR